MRTPVIHGMRTLATIPVLVVLLNHTPCMGSASKKYLSHPPVRPLPPLSSRPVRNGPSFFVNAPQGNDRSDGTVNTPWKTINHSLTQLKPGDTLYLRGGTYFENVYCAVAGTEKAPITIRSYPKERAIIDGAMALFQTSPQEAWKPQPCSPPR